MNDELGQVISNARKALGLSMRGAAKLAEISEGRWRQIEAGFKSSGNGGREPVRVRPATALAVADALRLPRGDVFEAAGLDPFTADAVAPKAVQSRSDPVLMRAADAAPRALGDYIGRAVALVLMNHEYDEHPDLDVHELAHCVLVLASIGKGGAS